MPEPTADVPAAAHVSPLAATTGLPRVVLRRRRARPFFGRHPWVFSGAIDHIDGQANDGDEVDLYTAEGQLVARGLLNRKSRIQVRLYSWDAERALDEAFWRSRLERAFRLRTATLGLTDPRGACRLVFSEGDGISGLIVDRYADWLVVQFTSLALANRRDMFARALVDLLQPKGIYLRTERGIGEAEGLELQDAPLWGAVPDGPVIIEEAGVRYGVDICTGQKTGFYLDQAANRRAVARYTAGRRVLDAFCYTGGFSLAAAVRGGARQVLGLDGSQAAIRLAELNAQLAAATHVQFECADVFQRLQQLAADSERFGVVILDPPKFARSAKAVEDALKGYHHLNRLAVSALEPEGILVTCSCSGHITRELFETMLAGVAEDTGRDIQLLEARGQAPDHPVSAACLETNYLKCFICRVI